LEIEAFLFCRLFRFLGCVLRFQFSEALKTVLRSAASDFPLRPAIARFAPDLALNGVLGEK
jgi:hypothetical protein